MQRGMEGTRLERGRVGAGFDRRKGSWEQVCDSPSSASTGGLLEPETSPGPHYPLVKWGPSGKSCETPKAKSYQSLGRPLAGSFSPLLLLSLKDLAASQEWGNPALLQLLFAGDSEMNETKERHSENRTRVGQTGW